MSSDQFIFNYFLLILLISSQLDWSDARYKCNIKYQLYQFNYFVPSMTVINDTAPFSWGYPDTVDIMIPMFMTGKLMIRDNFPKATGS